ncbi:hypothetical protein, partial [Martelella sp. AD-3]|uniref:hypothetical protein n=1 Tax=Martelella sp. AD-3 TaxID=686597 RepID=UPI001AEBBBD5
RDRFLSLLASPKANRQSRSPRFSFFKYSIVQITDAKVIASKYHSACQNPEVQTRQSAKLIGGGEVNIVRRESDRRPRR